MTNKPKKIEEYIDNKLRSSAVSRLSDDFNKHLMTKVSADYRIFASEAKTDRIIKYAIGSFISIVLGIIVLFGVVSKSSEQVEGNSTGININPAVQTSSNYLEKFIGFIQNIFVDILGSFGLTVSPSTIVIFLVGVFVIVLFLMGEKFLLKGRLKSVRARL